MDCAKIASRNTQHELFNYVRDLMASTLLKPGLRPQGKLSF